jgi:trehalose synthase
MMARVIDIREGMRLQDYAAVAHLAGAVRQLEDEGAGAVRALHGRTVWMVNSTAQGGGVAEMLPTMICLLRDLGVDVQWIVMETERPAFFPLTKRIHNLIHGAGDPELGSDDAELYAAVSRENADAMRERVKPGDVLVIHDPQPLGAGALLKAELGVPAVWRCHIGLDEQNAATRAAWSFLEPHALAFDRAVFTAPEYVPDYLAGRTTIIHPAVGPLTHKNRELNPNKLVGILCNGGLSIAYHPVLTPAFPEYAQRLQPSGIFGPAMLPEDLGLLYRPVVLQVSRWDRLKGWAPLIDAFVRLKTEGDGARSELHRRHIELCRLVLAGPDPDSIQDDPEGLDVIEELKQRYLGLGPRLQRDVALITLPMGSRKHNALLVNALQRAATVVVQNSIQEGFGLTVTEAMWKHAPVIGSHAVGIRQQVRDGEHGLLVQDPTDVAALAAAMDRLLGDQQLRDRCGRAAQRRVHDEFLVFAQLRKWLALLGDLVGAHEASGTGAGGAA